MTSDCEPDFSRTFIGLGKGSNAVKNIACSHQRFFRLASHARGLSQVRGKTSGVAVIGYSRGEFQLWHVPSAKVKGVEYLQSLRSSTESQSA